MILTLSVLLLRSTSLNSNCFSVELNRFLAQEKSSDLDPCPLSKDEIKASQEPLAPMPLNLCNQVAVCDTSHHDQSLYDFPAYDITDNTTEIPLNFLKGQVRF